MHHACHRRLTLSYSCIVLLGAPSFQTAQIGAFHAGPCDESTSKVYHGGCRSTPHFQALTLVQRLFAKLDVRTDLTVVKSPQAGEGLLMFEQQEDPGSSCRDPTSALSQVVNFSETISKRC